MGYKNPLIDMPAFERALELPVEQRLVIAAILKDIRHQANVNAERSWKLRKAPIAYYNRVVSTYARHIAHALTRDQRKAARPRCRPRALEAAGPGRPAL